MRFLHRRASLCRFVYKYLQWHAPIPKWAVRAPWSGTGILPAASKMLVGIDVAPLGAPRREVNATGRASGAAAATAHHVKLHTHHKHSRAQTQETE